MSVFFMGNLMFVLGIVFLQIMVVHGAPITSCDQTPYPHTCNSFIATDPYHPTSDQTHLTFRVMALRATMRQAQEAHRLISTMNSSSFNGPAKVAWLDCVELYEDTLYQLNRAIVNPVNIDDVQTYLSAAITNQETCKNGFADLSLSFHGLQSSPFMLTNFSELLSNALAINRASAAIPATVNRPSGRRLLSDDGGFPPWMSASDRKLLQQSKGPLEADVVVAKDGSGDYKSISDAVKASTKLRSGKGGRFVIYVKAGLYNEKVVISRTMKNLMLIGDGIGATIVSGNMNAQDGSTTFRSSTFAVSGAGFIARDMTFENTAGPEKHQAVAFRAGGDFSVLYRCSFVGYQDTLYAYAMRQFYRECDIYGTVDFIFGDAAAVFQSCNIYVRKPMSNQINTVTAQGRRDPNENTGIVIQNSRITAAPDLKPFQGSFKTFLGRPWKQYSRTVIMKTFLDDLIDPQGWTPWNGGFALDTLYYAEYMNAGAGASTGFRVKWGGYHLITSSTEAEKFTVGNFLDGDKWIPAGVPFTSGL
ncbi:hypothetical protein Nepgr_028107 [Nepenthes gracilis]|uniref:Pectinesterase n=1 Tax=Nepenthes gracilis TaxID=150966 RepID=A0AAD3Y3S5_NEPGR|nr:hypothetical protein Nepgr_028107 [Nepenthes gracilis]